MAKYVQKVTVDLAPQYKDEKYRSLVDQLWGDDDAEELERKQSRAQRIKFFGRERNRLRRWLEHDELASWDHEFRKHNPENFLSLLLGENVSTRARLRRYKMGFAYPTYQHASAIIHGSFVSPFIGYSEYGLGLSLLGTDEDVERQASHVRRFAHNNAFRLLQLRACIAHMCETAR